MRDDLWMNQTVHLPSQREVFLRVSQQPAPQPFVRLVKTEDWRVREDRNSRRDHRPGGGNEAGAKNQTDQILRPARSDHDCERSGKRFAENNKRIGRGDCIQHQRQKFLVVQPALARILQDDWRDRRGECRHERAKQQTAAIEARQKNQRSRCDVVPIH